MKDCVQQKITINCKKNILKWIKCDIINCIPLEVKYSNYLLFCTLKFTQGYINNRKPGKNRAFSTPRYLGELQQGWLWSSSPMDDLNLWSHCCSTESGTSVSKMNGFHASPWGLVRTHLIFLGGLAKDELWVSRFAIFFFLEIEFYKGEQIIKSRSFSRVRCSRATSN